MAASLFGPVRFVGVVGSDCPFDLAGVFAGRDVDLTGLEVRGLSKTFRWKGSYHGTMNEAVTDDVELNVLAEAPPKVPDAYKDSKFVFLANTAPELQNQLLKQIEPGAFIVADTMNCWIDGRLNELKMLLKKVHSLIVNDAEARALADESNLIKAAETILTLGPHVVIIKKGASGSMMCSNDGQKFVLPAYPVAEVKDPTGAGDSFAGALMGYLAKVNRTDFETLKTAIAYGTVAASFAIADFSLQGLDSISEAEIEQRFQELKKLTQF